MDPPRRRVATVGITDYAQEQLGDVVYVELPEIGRSRSSRARRPRWSNSVKAASEVYAPVSGEVVEVNEAIAGEPGQGQRRPAWATAGSSSCALPTQSELDALMDEAAYKAFVEEQH